MYVGQSKNILGRMNNYLNNYDLKAHKNKQPFPKALLKHGTDNFCLVIIEYLPLGMLDDREVLWITLLRPYYNILKGGQQKEKEYFHSKDTIEKLKEKAKGRILSAKPKVLISISTSGSNNPFFGLTHKRSTLNLISVANSAGAVYIYNKFKVLLFILSSVKLLAYRIDSTSLTITNTIKDYSLFRGGLYFTLKPFSPTDVPVISESNIKGLNDLTDQIKSSKHIRKAVFVFDKETLELLNTYVGVMECAKDLKISHTTIAKFIDKGEHYKAYLFSSHRLI